MLVLISFYSLSLPSKTTNTILEIENDHHNENTHSFTYTEQVDTHTLCYAQFHQQINQIAAESFFFALSLSLRGSI